MRIVFPKQIKKSTDKTANVNVITVNNVFCHWLNEIDARRYPDNIRILPTIQSKLINMQSNNYNIFQASP